MKLYVEGGGPKGKDLNSKCRRGFQKFITNAGIEAPDHILRIVACGPRGTTYKNFGRAIGQKTSAMLLVDSEEPVQRQEDKNSSKWQPWEHLKRRENWTKLDGSEDTDCHLMVQAMENWFLADPVGLENFFGVGFDPKCLPGEATPSEEIGKGLAKKLLEQASQNCQSPYKKGALSFELLGEICPAKVINRSPWACRFIDELRKKLQNEHSPTSE